MTERETSRAVNFLSEHYLVKGLPVYDTLMKPRLTSAGIRVKDHPELPEKALYQGGTVNNDHSNNVNVSHSNVGAVNAGDNAMQSGNSVSVTDSAALLAHIQEIHKRYLNFRTYRRPSQKHWTSLRRLPLNLSLTSRFSGKPSARSRGQ